MRPEERREHRVADKRGHHSGQDLQQVPVACWHYTVDDHACQHRDGQCHHPYHHRCGEHSADSGWVGRNPPGWGRAPGPPPPPTSKLAVGSSMMATPLYRSLTAFHPVLYRPAMGSTIVTPRRDVDSRTTKCAAPQCKMVPRGSTRRSSSSVATPRARNPYEVAASASSNALTPSRPVPVASCISASDTCRP